jgi:hypothetical protein
VKTTAIITLFVLVILSWFIHRIFTFTTILTKGTSDKKPILISQLSRTRKIILYSFISLYFVIFFSAMLWVIYELAGDALISVLGISMRQLALITVVWTAIMIGAFSLEIYYLKKTGLYNKPPLKDSNISEGEYLEVQKKYEHDWLQKANYLFDHMWHYISVLFAVVFGFLLLMGITAWLIIVFIH